MIVRWFSIKKNKIYFFYILSFVVGLQHNLMHVESRFGYTTHYCEIKSFKGFLSYENSFKI